jgi:hypothetical protein
LVQEWEIGLVVWEMGLVVMVLELLVWVWVLELVFAPASLQVLEMGSVPLVMVQGLQAQWLVMELGAV